MGKKTGILEVWGLKIEKQKVKKKKVKKNFFTKKFYLIQITVIHLHGFICSFSKYLVSTTQ